MLSNWELMLLWFINIFQYILYQKREYVPFGPSHHFFSTEFPIAIWMFRTQPKRLSGSKYFDIRFKDFDRPLQAKAKENHFKQTKKKSKLLERRGDAEKSLYFIRIVFIHHEVGLLKKKMFLLFGWILFIYFISLFIIQKCHQFSQYD